MPPKRGTPEHEIWIHKLRIKANSRSKEHCEKISASRKGIKCPHVSERNKTEASRKNMSKKMAGKSPWNKGKKCPQLSGKNNPHFGRKHTEETRLKNIEFHVGGFWYGNVKYYPSEYCELWEDVNPRVHAFFNHTCCLCHTHESNHSRVVGHHVFYVKKACCWQSDDGIYYTNLNAIDHPAHDYYIGENPNYFVILCQSCHGKTNGKFENRKKWADYFRKMIDEEYDGVCYLPKK